MDTIAIVLDRNRRWSAVQVASTFFDRLRGLLFRHELSAGDGLLLERCNCVHTCGMGFPIDIVFIDRHWQVTSTVSQLKPFRAKSDTNASMVLELRSGQVVASGIIMGDKLLVESSR